MKQRINEVDFNFDCFANFSVPIPDNIIDGQFPSSLKNTTAWGVILKGRHYLVPQKDVYLGGDVVENFDDATGARTVTFWNEITVLWICLSDSKYISC